MHAQRAGGSILVAAGLGELLIGSSYDEYVSIATRLGTDSEFCSMVPEQLSRARSGDTLFKPQAAVEAMVAGLHEAYRKWKEGERPEAIHAHKELSLKNLDPKPYVGGEL